MKKSTDKTFSNFHLIEHPLLSHKLAILRNANTSKKEFNELAREITLILTIDATKTLPVSKTTIQTPMEETDAWMLSAKPVVLPILRAGIGMLDGFLSLIPSAHVGHIGLYRDEETLKPHHYYFKIPKGCDNCHYFICDPMLATSGTADATIQQLKNVGIKKITFICIIASPEGLEKLSTAHPDVEIYAASVDRELNQQGFILPGLGDAGDRLFGTDT